MSTVRETDPKATTMVKRGDTIKILVKGAAPLATVPDLKGRPCADAASRIVDRGLYPDRTGPGATASCTSQTPTATDPQTLRWNDQVQISCGLSGRQGETGPAFRRGRRQDLC